MICTIIMFFSIYILITSKLYFIYFVNVWGKYAFIKKIEFETKCDLNMFLTSLRFRVCVRVFPAPTELRV